MHYGFTPFYAFFILTKPVYLANFVLVRIESANIYLLLDMRATLYSYIPLVILS